MSDDLKAQYFESHIREKIGRVLKEQKGVFASREREIAGSPGRGEMIRRALEGVTLEIRKEGEGVVASMSYPVEIRFFDMKRILDWRIYNRRLWGTAYSELLGDIKYEFEDWLRKHYPEQLKRYGY